MTNPYRAMCAELLDEAIYLGSVPSAFPPSPELVARARALLAKPVAEGPTDEEFISYWYEVCEGEGEEGILRFARYVRRTNHLEKNK